VPDDPFSVSDVLPDKGLRIPDRTRDAPASIFGMMCSAIRPRASGSAGADTGNHNEHTDRPASESPDFSRGERFKHTPFTSSERNS
jgi:hypothetical protein